ncbi:MAG: hypothetical protein ACI9MJ_001921 [Alphaproteobacteria bacterium]|jgi:hypothetical protein
MERSEFVQQDERDTETESKTDAIYEAESGNDESDDPGATEILDILRRDWGDEFDANLSYARDAVERFADTDLIALFEETGLGNNPRVVRAAAQIGQQLATENTQGPSDLSGARPLSGKNGLNAELDRLIASPEYWTSGGQRRARDIFVRLNGSGELPVHRHPGDGGSSHVRS